jgi:hypothetical protein
MWFFQIQQDRQYPREGAGAFWSDWGCGAGL